MCNFLPGSIFLYAPPPTSNPPVELFKPSNVGFRGLQRQSGLSPVKGPRGASVATQGPEGSWGGRGGGEQFTGKGKKKGSLLKKHWQNLCFIWSFNQSLSLSLSCCNYRRICRPYCGDFEPLKRVTRVSNVSPVYRTKAERESP